MIVAIHQPNFLPWLGYFEKMRRADVFVFLDSVPFSKGSYTNRVRVKSTRGSNWLTVPVLTKGKSGQLIRDVRCNRMVRWGVKMVKTLQATYGRSEHFSKVCDWFSPYLVAEHDSLCCMNIMLIYRLASSLGLGKEPVTVRSSDLGVAGESTSLLITICQKLGADTYLSGSGGENYQDEEAFQRAGIKLEYLSFEHPTYPQLYGDFVKGLSTIDLLFNCGPDSPGILRKSSFEDHQDSQSG